MKLSKKQFLGKKIQILKNALNICLAHETMLEKNWQLFLKNIKILNTISHLEHSNFKRKTKPSKTVTLFNL